LWVSAGVVYLFVSAFLGKIKRLRIKTADLIIYLSKMIISLITVLMPRRLASCCDEMPIGNGVPAPCLNRALNYFDGLSFTERLPSNLLQLQRD